MPCSFPNACIPENTKQCANGWGNYYCDCKEGWFGPRCELDSIQAVKQESPTETTVTSSQRILIQQDENILIPDTLESNELELITEKIDSSDAEETLNLGEIEEKQAMIRQQLERLEDLYALILMMQESAKEESTV